MAIGTAIAAGSALASLFGGKKKDTVRLEDLLSPEQRAAQQALLQFGQSGQLGDFQAGAEFPGSLGDFQLTGIEGDALQNLSDLINAGDPRGLGEAEQVFRGFANTEFNPDDPSSGFAAFARQVARATGDANDVLSRESAITGNRLNSRLLQERGDLQARGNDALMSELARLFESAQNRKVAGAQGLTGIAELSDRLNRGRLATAFGFGGLERDLRTQEAQAKYNDFIRQRNERLGSIGALQTVLQKDTPFGQTSRTDSSPSALSQLGAFGLNQAAESGVFDRIFNPRRSQDNSDLIRNLSSLVNASSLLV